MSDADWKCDLCGRKQDGDMRPPKGWMLLVAPDRYTNLNEDRVLCTCCVDLIRLTKREVDRE